MSNVNPKATPKLAPIDLTAKQRKWLVSEKERTGETFGTIVRLLINDQINLKKKS